MELAAMTVREVAGYLNVDEKTIYRLASRGELPGFKVAGTWRFKKDDIDQSVDRGAEGASARIGWGRRPEPQAANEREMNANEITLHFEEITDGEDQ